MSTSLYWDSYEHNACGENLRQINPKYAIPIVFEPNGIEGRD